MSMISDEERKNLMEYLQSEIESKGKLTDSSDIFDKYNLKLPKCSVYIICPKVGELDPIFEILDCTVYSDFQPETEEDQLFDEVRKLYRGDKSGLVEIELHGTKKRENDSFTAKRMFRYKDGLEDGRGLAESDEEEFNDLLKYVERYIKDIL